MLAGVCCTVAALVGYALAGWSGLAATAVGVLALLVPSLRSRNPPELSQQESLERAVFEHALDGKLIADGSGRFTEANRAAAQLLAYSREQLIGKSLVDLIAPGSPVNPQALWEAFLARGQMSSELELVTGDGRQRRFELSSVANVLPGKHLSILRDVTERKLLDAQLALVDRLMSVGTLAAGVAHELNNPLAYVSANIAFVGDQLLELAAQARREGRAVSQGLLNELDEALQDARQGAERMRIIIRDLKLFARGDETVMGPVVLEKVLEQCISMAWNEVRHRARLVREFAQVPPAFGNESRLSQVFLNLLVNAAQAIPDGHAESNCIVVRTLAVDGNDDEVAVEIEDSGVGIPPENLGRIFDPFFTTKAVGIGTGLGLSICHNLVVAHGGRIEVDSQVGKGARFRVTLRTGLADSALLPAGGKLLVIDDEPQEAATIQRTLAGEHEVVTVMNEAQALELVSRGERFDLVLGMHLQGSVEKRFGPLAGKVVVLEKPFQLEALRKLVRERLAS